MLRALALSLTLAALGAGVASAQSEQALGKSVHDSEVQWRTAISLANWSAVEMFMAPDFVVTDQNGKRQTRAEYLRILKRGDVTFAAVPSPTYRTLVSGRTVVHLGEANQMATGKDGTATRTHIVWTDTWVRADDGQWVCLASQYAEYATTP